MTDMAPVVVEFEVYMEADRVIQKDFDKVGVAVHKAVGFIQYEDADIVRLAYLVEGTDENYSFMESPSYTFLIIPKMAILKLLRTQPHPADLAKPRLQIASRSPVAVEIVDYLDHLSFGNIDPMNEITPSKCTAYGSIQKETDEFLRLVHFFKDAGEDGDYRHDGIVIVKSAILNRETFVVVDEDV